MKVYLAGPITGLDHKTASDWREYAIGRLLPIIGMSPMRGADLLRSIGPISATHEAEQKISPLFSPKAIMTRDHYDCITCDLLMVNLLPAVKPIVGTAMEMAWAHDRHIPVVCVLPKNHFKGNEALYNSTEHAMVQQTVGFRVDTLDEAIDVARVILLGPRA